MHFPAVKIQMQLLMTGNTMLLPPGHGGYKQDSLLQKWFGVNHTSWGGSHLFSISIDSDPSEQNR